MNGTPSNGNCNKHTVDRIKVYMSCLKFRIQNVLHYIHEKVIITNQVQQSLWLNSVTCVNLVYSKRYQAKFMKWTKLCHLIWHFSNKSCLTFYASVMFKHTTEIVLFLYNFKMKTWQCLGFSISVDFYKFNRDIYLMEPYRNLNCLLEPIRFRFTRWDPIDGTSSWNSKTCCLCRQQSSNLLILEHEWRISLGKTKLKKIPGSNLGCDGVPSNKYLSLIWKYDNV